MHLSTSSSENSGVGRTQPEPDGRMNSRTGIILLVAGLVMMMLGLELGSPMILEHLSRTERRVATELRAVSRLPPVTTDGRPTVLLAGNSLLLEGVQLDRLHEDLAPQFEVSRLGIEQTHYLDWYFGLRRLLQEGSRPSLIVLTLGTDQLATRVTLGEYFAHLQMSARDFPLAIQRGKLDRTTASTYLFAHWSNWLADKRVIRQRVMILLVPNFRELAGRIAAGPHENDPGVLLAMARQDLPELADLSRTYGVKIVLLVPPALREDHSRQVQELGAQLDVPVWVPSPPGEFPRSLYRDGFHLNEQGAAIFTSRLADQLRQTFSISSGCCKPAGTKPSRTQN
jgi:lysophospholipase L1-like esterase